MDLTERITRALDALSEDADPPTSPFVGPIGLMWASSLGDAASGDAGRFIRERPAAAPDGARADAMYVPLAIVGDSGRTRPPHPTVLRVAPNMQYHIPAWYYRTASFSFFVWIRIGKGFAEPAVILADWSEPRCLLFSATAERALSLVMQTVTPEADENGRPPPPEEPPATKSKRTTWRRDRAEGPPPSTLASQKSAVRIDLAPVLHPVDIVRLASAPGAVTNEAWAHVGFTYDIRAGQAKLYVNGKVVGEQTTSSEIRSLAPHLRQHLCLGYSDHDAPGSPGCSFLGHMSDARFYRGVVPLDELLADAGAQR